MVKMFLSCWAIFPQEYFIGYNTLFRYDIQYYGKDLTLESTQNIIYSAPLYSSLDPPAIKFTFLLALASKIHSLGIVRVYTRVCLLWELRGALLAGGLTLYFHDIALLVSYDCAYSGNEPGLAIGERKDWILRGISREFFNTRA